jgi:hypothetical protein
MIQRRSEGDGPVPQVTAIGDHDVSVTDHMREVRARNLLARSVEALPRVVAAKPFARRRRGGPLAAAGGIRVFLTTRT